MVSASIFGGSANTDIPVCLAYNQVHYECLVPSSDEDILKTTNLTRQFLNGEYDKTMADIPIFIEKAIQNYEEEFPSLDSQSKKIHLITKQIPAHKTIKDISLTAETDFQKSLPENLKGKRPRDMDNEEKKRVQQFEEKILPEKRI